MYNTLQYISKLISMWRH